MTSNATLPPCFLCKRSLEELPANEREQHAKSCLERTFEVTEKDPQSNPPGSSKGIIRAGPFQFQSLAFCPSCSTPWNPVYKHNEASSEKDFVRTKIKHVKRCMKETGMLASDIIGILRALSVAWESEETTPAKPALCVSTLAREDSPSSITANYEESMVSPGHDTCTLEKENRSLILSETMGEIEGGNIPRPTPTDDFAGARKSKYFVPAYTGDNDKRQKQKKTSNGISKIGALSNSGNDECGDANKGKPNITIRKPRKPKKPTNATINSNSVGLGDPVDLELPGRAAPLVKPRVRTRQPAPEDTSNLTKKRKSRSKKSEVHKDYNNLSETLAEILKDDDGLLNIPPPGPPTIPLDAVEASAIEKQREHYNRAPLPLNLTLTSGLPVPLSEVHQADRRIVGPLATAFPELPDTESGVACAANRDTKTNETKVMGSQASVPIDIGSEVHPPTPNVNGTSENPETEVSLNEPKPDYPAPPKNRGRPKKFAPEGEAPPKKQRAPRKRKSPAVDEPGDNLVEQKPKKVRTSKPKNAKEPATKAKKAPKTVKVDKDGKDEDQPKVKGRKRKEPATVLSKILLGVIASEHIGRKANALFWSRFTDKECHVIDDTEKEKSRTSRSPDSLWDLASVGKTDGKMYSEFPVSLCVMQACSVLKRSCPASMSLVEPDITPTNVNPHPFLLALTQRAAAATAATQKRTKKRLADENRLKLIREEEERQREADRLRIEADIEKTTIEVEKVTGAFERIMARKNAELEAKIQEITRLHHAWVAKVTEERRVLLENLESQLAEQRKQLKLCEPELPATGPSTSMDIEDDVSENGDNDDGIAGDDDEALDILMRFMETDLCDEVADELEDPDAKSISLEQNHMAEPNDVAKKQHLTNSPERVETDTYRCDVGNEEPVDHGSISDDPERQHVAKRGDVAESLCLRDSPDRVEIFSTHRASTITNDDKTSTKRTLTPSDKHQIKLAEIVRLSKNSVSPKPTLVTPHLDFPRSYSQIEGGSQMPAPGSPADDYVEDSCDEDGAQPFRTIGLSYQVAEDSCDEGDAEVDQQSRVPQSDVNKEAAIHGERQEAQPEFDTNVLSREPSNIARLNLRDSENYGPSPVKESLIYIAHEEAHESPNPLIASYDDHVENRDALHFKTVNKEDARPGGNDEVNEPSVIIADRIPFKVGDRLASLSPRSALSPARRAIGMDEKEEPTNAYNDQTNDIDDESEQRPGENAEDVDKDGNEHWLNSIAEETSRCSDQLNSATVATDLLEGCFDRNHHSPQEDVSPHLPQEVTYNSPPAAPSREPMFEDFDQPALNSDSLAERNRDQDDQNGFVDEQEAPIGYDNFNEENELGDAFLVYSPNLTKNHYSVVEHDNSRFSQSPQPIFHDSFELEDQLLNANNHSAKHYVDGRRAEHSPPEIRPLDAPRSAVIPQHDSNASRSSSAITAKASAKKWETLAILAKRNLGDQLKDMPDYSAMSIKQLQRLADGYGIRPCAKSILVEQLTKIWLHLNGFSVSFTGGSAVVPGQSSDRPKQFPPSAHAPDVPQPMPGEVVRKELSNDDELDPPDGEGRDECVLDDLEESDEEGPTGKIKVTDEMIFQYLRKNRELYRRILRYEPLDFTTIHRQMNADGLKCSKKSLISFLDAKAVNYVQPVPGGANPGRRRRT
ncbi:hypothetical protein BJ742DRAFT_814154 [Cladochytrium replicatum]|nr:hypothetical protein BJ742DRAFT_814154 [Cladochytrium replicatum]